MSINTVSLVLYHVNHFVFFHLGDLHLGLELLLLSQGVYGIDVCVFSVLSQFYLCEVGGFLCWKGSVCQLLEVGLG